MHTYTHIHSRQPRLPHTGRHPLQALHTDRLFQRSHRPSPQLLLGASRLGRGGAGGAEAPDRATEAHPLQTGADTPQAALPAPAASPMLTPRVIRGHVSVSAAAPEPVTSHRVPVTSEESRGPGTSADSRALCANTRARAHTRTCRVKQTCCGRAKVLARSAPMSQVLTYEMPRLIMALYQR